MRVRIILDVDIDVEKWKAGNHGRTPTLGVVESAIVELINYSNAGYDGEMYVSHALGIRAYEISSNETPAGRCTAYKTRAKRR